MDLGVDIALAGTHAAKFKMPAGAGTASKGAWLIAGSLTLKVVGGLTAGTSYVFSFDVQNKATAQGVNSTLVGPAATHVSRA